MKNIAASNKILRQQGGSVGLSPNSFVVYKRTKAHGKIGKEGTVCSVRGNRFAETSNSIEGKKFASKGSTKVNLNPDCYPNVFFVYSVYSVPPWQFYSKAINFRCHEYSEKNLFATACPATCGGGTEYTEINLKVLRG
jgi:hypothetical protein